ncbi:MULTISPECIES: glycosyltransferase family 2 protein [unclassified Variovorax]|uniref:glycosyltransferase n=1 Tax=unclassified Variovorax TaxID=663243 RepID=UPI001BD46F28|nr:MULTISPECIES: glycosyltransferase family 2 protein [unclassified Variovorax]
MSSATAARTALVLETNNLHDGPGMELVSSSLQRLILLLGQQTLPLTSLAQVVITHDGLPPHICKSIERLAQRPIDFVAIDPYTGYYDAKNVGFDMTDAALCDYVAFADADCLPAADWLERLLEPLDGPEGPSVVAGRTSYDTSLTGIALTTLDFMYFPSPLRQGGTRNFYANNVVFRRDVFERYSYQVLDGVYRAQCEVLGLRLQAAGVPVCYEARAHTQHRLPGTRRDWFKLRWLRGQDSRGLTPLLVETCVPAPLQWLARSGPIGTLCVQASRMVFSLRAINHQDLPRVRGLRWLGTALLVMAYSAVDMAGGLFRGFGAHTLDHQKADEQALSYHR